MKILQVIPYFPPAYAFGGPVEVSYQISKELVKRGHEVIVYTSDAGNYSSRLNIESIKFIDGIEVHYFRNLSLASVKILKLFITPQLISHAKKEVKKFDVIHLHEYRTFQNIVVANYARKYGVPYVLQAHGSLPRIMPWRRLKWVYDIFVGYWLLWGASKVIALTRVEARQYKAMGVPEEKITIVPNGINLSEYANLPPKGLFKKKFNIKEEEKIILYLGRINKSKGLDLLAKAFKIVSKEFGNVRLVIVGPDDGYAATFSRLIASLGIEEKVLMTGFVKKEDKLAALVDSDVFVTPRFSGFPVTFLEACLAGCPIITTSDELDWIHNNVGYVVESSPTALAKAILSIMKDDEKYVKFRINCKSIIKNFDIARIASQLEALYTSMVKNHRVTDGRTGLE
ncbi:MAG: glycosyltransferase [Thermofilaceae archaeon]